MKLKSIKEVSDHELNIRLKTLISLDEICYYLGFFLLIGSLMYWRIEGFNSLIGFFCLFALNFFVIGQEISFLREYLMRTNKLTELNHCHITKWERWKFHEKIYNEHLHIFVAFVVTGIIFIYAFLMVLFSNGS